MDVLSIAQEVIDEKGLFSESRGKKVVKNFPSLRGGLFDLLLVEHIKNVFTFFSEKREGNIRLRQLSFPLANPFVDHLIRLTLGKQEGAPFEKREISVALLAALLTPLRQTVGSCFATAPLILVQLEHIEFLFEDLYNLMTRGFLRRVIAGEEYKVPISVKIGLHGGSPLMKCYEYTAASFADWKPEFYKWNMYTSLGLHHEEKGGIGERLYEAINEKLGMAQTEANQLVDEIRRIDEQITYTEALLHSAFSPNEIRRLKADMQYKSYQINLAEDGYHEKAAKADRLVKFFQFLINQFLSLFPHYFQEVYDPDMKSESGAIYEDRPAGFRLLYKQGRSDPTFWTMIYNADEYKKALIDFLHQIEPVVILACEWREGKELIPEMLGLAEERINDPVFIEAATKRISAMHQEKLVESSERKPWAYVSGGNTESFVKCYFSLQNDLAYEALFPQTPEQLASGLIELMKDLPYKTTNQFEKGTFKGLLMVSPNHAFALKPGLPDFLRAWQWPGNTFTYVRDEIIGKAIHWYENHPLSAKDIKSISEAINIALPAHETHVKQLYLLVQEQFPHVLTLFEEVAHQFFLRQGAPNPLLFADSNWRSDFFAFVVNPGTFELELWLSDGIRSRPLPEWRPLFAGQKWLLYTKPEQLTPSLLPTPHHLR